MKRDPNAIETQPKQGCAQVVAGVVEVRRVVVSGLLEGGSGH
jgi:hypothetical protein